SLTSLGLFHVLGRELERHQLEQLNTKFGAAEILIFRSRNTANWQRVRQTFDAWSMPTQTTRFWVSSSDPQFTYGETSQIEPPARRGAHRLSIDGRESRWLVRSVPIPANGSRAAVQLMVGVDTTSVASTQKAIAVALVVLSLVGVTMVTILGYVIAAFGLNPLRRLSREARAIGPKNLGQRLSVSQLPAEVADVASGINTALDRLESSWQQLEVFNAEVAHELRTPLTNLIGQTQVALRRERSAPHLEEVLHSNLEELERLRTVVNDMLFLARADQGERATNLLATSIAEEIRKTVEFLDYLREESGVRIVIEGDAHAQVDVALFRRAVINLLHNAIQHSERNSDIRVRIDILDRQVSIAVENHGPEIAEYHLPRLFDRFYRVGSAGLGLGLSIVKAIALMHRGRVFARCENGNTIVGFSVAAM
ncbi:heavy metal sensor histidine kinase, partial [Steroidobacter sp.]|uniref:heavy metal sensor histidine kinase n=1 Tax=Steroidobacter sp. TaxID=1978227 RepID=UPI001A50F207